MLDMLDINQFVQTTEKIGVLILNIQSRNYDVRYKSDKSPVTTADTLSCHKILEFLQKVCPDIPVISEEETSPPYKKRQPFEWVWLLDPLDGTKEFIRGEKDYAINLALIHGTTPVFGVMHLPAYQKTYYAIAGKGCFKHESNRTSKLSKPASHPGTCNVVASKSHFTDETKAFVESLHASHKIINLSFAGSSYKFCLLAEGVADVYPRLAPTMEWDTATGHIIIKEAGKNIYVYDTNKELEYNKSILRNPSFVAR